MLEKNILINTKKKYTILFNFNRIVTCTIQFFICVPPWITIAFSIFADAFVIAINITWTVKHYKNDRTYTQLSNFLDFSPFWSTGITAFCDFRICDPCYFVILKWKEHIFFQDFNLGKKINAYSLDILQKKVEIVMQIWSKTGLLNVFGTILRFYYIRCP